MGEIADGLINGDFDSVTGEYLGEGFGYPRTIHNGRIVGYAGEGKNSNVNGVKKFLMRFEMESKDYHKHCVEFIDKCQIQRTGNSNSWATVSNIIQDNWQRFVQYTDKRYKRKDEFRKRKKKRARTS